jgi:hypothetical protein
MINVPLYFLDGVKFASGYERVVHGGRGKYVELVKDEILVNLRSHFGTPVPETIKPEPFYYHWLEPVDRNEKIYWQIRTVRYADYKIGYFYVSPALLMPFLEVDPHVKPLF